MKKTRFTEAQVMGVLRQMEGDVPAAELCREHGSKAASNLILWIKFPPNQRDTVQMARQVRRHGCQLDRRRMKLPNRADQYEDRAKTLNS